MEHNREVVVHSELYQAKINYINPPILASSQANQQWLSGSRHDLAVHPSILTGPTSYLTPFLIRDDGFGAATIPNEPKDIQGFMRLKGLKTKTTVYDVPSQSAEDKQSTFESLLKWKAKMDRKGVLAGEMRHINIVTLNGTILDKQYQPARLHSDIGLNETYHPEGTGRVPKFAHLSWRGSWTSWHVDYAGAGAAFTMRTGEKVFFFIRPTPKNLMAYRKWDDDPGKFKTWLGDSVDTVYAVSVRAGETLILPPGMIHAVYTVEDTLAYSVGFLTLHTLPLHIDNDLWEESMGYTGIQKYPGFKDVLWKVGEAHAKLFEEKRRLDGMDLPPDWLTPVVRESLEALVGYMERNVGQGGTDAQKDWISWLKEGLMPVYDEIVLDEFD